MARFGGFQRSYSYGGKSSFSQGETLTRTVLAPLERLAVAIFVSESSPKGRRNHANERQR
ncbi:MAG: hypothetical protein PUP93_20010 [Rhizonema sp. NSF051]|nr:hypothetical protein [Rhizonema sp. NSF051]